MDKPLAIQIHLLATAVIFLIDVAFDRHIRSPQQTSRPGASTDVVLQPGAEEDVLPLEMEDGRLGEQWVPNGLVDASSQGGAPPFVGIHHQHPVAGILDLTQRRVPLTGVVVKFPLINSCTRLPRQRYRPVGAEGIEHHHITTPFLQRPYALDDVPFLVQREDNRCDLDVSHAVTLVLSVLWQDSHPPRSRRAHPCTRTLWPPRQLPA